MKIYTGFRDSAGVAHVNVQAHPNDVGHKLRHIQQHSPDGIEWGYGGSGPSDLALSILSDYYNDAEFAIRAHQKFKWDKISFLPKTGFTLTGEVIEQWREFYEAHG